MAGLAPDETTDQFERTETTDAPAEETTDAADDTELIVGADDPGSRRVYFIGIAGPSGSGKTSLAKRLTGALNSPLNAMSMDVYFAPDKMPVHPQHGTNWETPQGVDFQALLQDLHSIETTMSSTEVVPNSLLMKSSPSTGGGDIVRSGMGGRPLAPGAPVIVIVEGFLLFYDRQISSMFDCTLWVQADCATCSRRRHQRKRPDMPFERFDEWYTGLVWEHFTMYQDRQLANADGAMRLDGTQPEQFLQEEAVAYCKARLSLR